MVDELDVGDAAPSVNADSDCNQEIIFRRGSKKTNNFFINNNVILLSHIPLRIDILLANMSELLALLREESEPLIEREVLLPLVRDLEHAILLAILVQLELDLQPRVLLVVADLELGQVAELSDQGVLVETAKEPQSNGLDLLVRLGRQGLIVRVLQVSHGDLLVEVRLF